MTGVAQAYIVAHILRYVYLPNVAPTYRTVRRIVQE